MIKAIVFDYGGVIEFIDNGLIRKIISFLDISIEDWYKEYFSLNYLSNIKNIPYRELFMTIAKNLGASNEHILQVGIMVDDNLKTRKLNTELIEIIKKLKSNYKIGIITNNTSNFRDKLKSDGIYDLFNTIIVSSEVGVQKPQPEIFTLCFNQLGVKSEEVIFIDDSISSLSLANSIGYNDILYKNNADLLEQFKKYKIIL